MANEQHKVGYGSPPKHTQFKKGNPGRRKRPNPAALDQEAARQQVVTQEVKVTRDGRRTTVQANVAVYEVLLGMSLNRDVQAARLLLRPAANDAAPSSGAPTVDAEATLPAENEALIERFFVRRDRQRDGLPVVQRRSVSDADNDGGGDE
jgi:hypothetical protein